MLATTNFIFISFVSCILITLFTLPLFRQIISVILGTMLIFFITVLILFFYHVEFLSILILLISCGAVLVLFLFALFTTSSATNFNINLLTKELTYFVFYFILCFKAILFSNIYFFKYLIFTQMSIVTEIFEMNFLYELYSHNFGPILLLVGFLLLIITVGISGLFKKAPNGYVTK